MTKTSLEEIIDETAKLGGERPSLSRMQAQLDRIEAMLAAILDYIYIRDDVAVG